MLLKWSWGQNLISVGWVLRQPSSYMKLKFKRRNGDLRFPFPDRLLILFLPDLPLIAGACGCAPTYLLGWDIVENTATRPNHRIGSNLNAWGNEAICGNPGTITDRNGCGDQAKS